LSGTRAIHCNCIQEKTYFLFILKKKKGFKLVKCEESVLLSLQVILSPDAAPPVVRIMDYNKYRYELQKKKRVQQRKSAASRKELKMGYNIDQHDYDVRLRAARKFLKDGNKVKVIVNLKGRENDFRNIAIELIRCFQNDIGELATEESKKFRDRNIFITLVPNKVLQKTQEPPRKKDKSAINEVSAGV
ncbi:translation initiation factor IF3-4, chloroplastic, partial [Manihot esculenta]